jgi:hypothetical protein
MRVSGWAGFGVLAVAMLASGTRLLAQDRDDARWRDDCHERSGSSFRARYCEVRVQNLGARKGPLSVDASQNGSIEIAGSAGDSIIVHELIQVEAFGEDEGRGLASQVQVVTTGDVIHAEAPASVPRHWAVSYRIYVPEHTDLTLKTVNGPVVVDGVTGRMQLEAVNGPIELTGVGGDVRARARNGPLEVRLGGTRWDGAGLDAETENGPIELSLPANYAAHLETSTVNGPMEIDFPVTMQGRINPRRIAIDLGGGGPPVRVVTTNGPVSVTKN